MRKYLLLLQEFLFLSDRFKEFAPTGKGNLVRLTLPPNEKVRLYFLGISERKGVYPSFYMYIEPFEIYYADLIQTKAGNAIFIGFMLMMFLYNLILFFFEKDRSFIYYSAYLIMMVIYSGYMSEDIADLFGAFLFPNEPKYYIFLKLSIYMGLTPPDLLLLDVNLKGMIDGVETAQVLQKENINVPIIYLTANSDESTFERAKETKPYAFISKPYKKIDLQRAIELTISRMASEHTESEPKELNESSSTPENTPYILSDRIFVRQKNKMVKLFLADILYVEAERSYCRIVTNDAEFLLSTPLKKLSEKLEPKFFFRLHRSYIVNMQKIDEVAESHIVVSGKVIPIGKSYKEAFVQRIQMI